MSGCPSSPLASADSLAPAAIGFNSTPAGAASIGAAPAATDSQPAGLSLAAHYARVSTDKQEKDATMASQVAALQTAAQTAGYTVPPEYVFQDGLE